LIGDVQRVIGIYGLADHFLVESSNDKHVHEIFDDIDCSWSMMAGSRHVDFLVSEVGKLRDILPALGLHNSDAKKNKDSAIYACDIYGKMHESGTHPFKVLYIDALKLFGACPDIELIAALGVLSWNESSWYRRPFLTDRIQGLCDGHKTAAINRGIEHFVNSLGNFLCGESPAPSFIPLHNDMDEEIRNERLRELKRHVPNPLEISHVVPGRYCERNNPYMVDGTVIWVYPVRLIHLNSGLTSQEGSKDYMHREYAKAIMGIMDDDIRSHFPHIEYALFSGWEVKKGFEHTFSKRSVENAKKLLLSALGEHDWIIKEKTEDEDGLTLKMRTLCEEGTPDDDMVVRVARKYNNNILKNFVLFMIRPSDSSF
jgi:hypothetical protein